MNRKKVIFIILIIFIIGISIYFKMKPNNSEQNIQQVEEVEELKEETGIIGNSELYDIQTEYDGNKVLSIKPNIQYKIAFAGIIKQGKPNNNEIDTIFEEQYPRKNGIWIDVASREKFQQMLKECVNNEYEITEKGYLKIKNEVNPTEIDNSLKQMIESNKKYIITISGIYYEADIVTGEILDNFYEDMDPYQATKIVNEKDDIIIFASTNTQKKLTAKEILQEIIAYK